MSSGDWDDLFALAQGRAVSNAKSDAQEANQESGQRRKASSSADASRTLAKKKARAGHDSVPSFHSFLRNRTSNTTTLLPVGVVFASSLMTMGGDDTPPTTTTTTCSKAKFSTHKPSKPCKRCGASRFRHKIQPTKQASSSQQQHYQLDLFCLLRNLRHVCFLRIKENHQKAAFGSPFLSLARRELQMLKGKLNFLQPYAPQLQSKLDKLMNRLSRHHQKVTAFDLVEENIRLIMDCDAIYYDLYYAEITMGANHNRLDYIPHPVVYFGEGLQELAHAQEYVEEHAPADDKDNDALLRARFSLDCQLEDEDPLTVIHHVRFLETIQLFQLSGWLSQEEQRVTELAKAARAPVASGLYGMHETPAPPLLRAWRDSCRDFITHLYAYATIPTLILKEIREFVENERVVEVGAGTGYLASLLQSKGVAVNAFDCRPGKQNEYHGSTPTFLPVTAGDGYKVMKKEQSPFVLLLCYPPPDSSMAVDTLRSFLKRGGKRFVYVGEFKGLTATSAFERVLTAEFTCTRRLLCPKWGTDAAFVTLWERKTQGASSTVLLPCVICGAESHQRLRFVRYLHYCSAACWNKHVASSDLSKHLKFACVALGAQTPDFADPLAFLEL